MARDFGFAPNPFFGACTLATCKPVIRRTADIGDWIVGTSSCARGQQCRLVFVMRVSEAVSFDQYWNDPRFVQKRPSLEGNKMRAYGDNIYHHDPATSVWLQEPSHHSYEDGSPNPHNIANDTKTDRILISANYVYWGGSGPVIPDQFRDWDGFDIWAGRGQKNHFPQEMVEAFLEWVNSLEKNGYVARPLKWQQGKA